MKSQTMSNNHPMTPAATIHHHDCWYTRITREVATKLGLRRFNQHVGKYLVLECTDLLEQGQIVSRSAIQRQLKAWGR